MSRLELAAARTSLTPADVLRAGVVSRLGGAWIPLFGLIAAFALWEGAVRITGTPTFVLPTPSATLERLWRELPSLSYELLFTLAGAGIGLTIGFAIGILGGVVMAQWRMLERSLFPLAVVLKLVPFIAIAPLLRIWLGYELAPKIFLAALITFFPVLVNCISGLRAADPLALELFQSVGADRTETLRHLRWHFALPYLFAALKLGVNLAVIGALVGEFFGSDHGIGNVISLADKTIDMRLMFAAIVLLAITGVVLTVLTNVLERRVLFWHESVRS